MAPLPANPTDNQAFWQWIFWLSLAQALANVVQEDGYKPLREFPYYEEQRQRAKKSIIYGQATETVSKPPAVRATHAADADIGIQAIAVQRESTHAGRSSSRAVDQQQLKLELEALPILRRAGVDHTSTALGEPYPFEVSSRLHTIMKLSPLYCVADGLLLLLEITGLRWKTGAPFGTVITSVWFYRTSEDESKVQECTKNQQIPPWMRLVIFCLLAGPLYIKLMSARGIVLYQVCGTAWLSTNMLLGVLAFARQQVVVEAKTSTKKAAEKWGVFKGFDRDHADILEEFRKRRVGYAFFAIFAYESLLLTNTSYLLREVLRRTTSSPVKSWGYGTLIFVITAIFIMPHPFFTASKLYPFWVRSALHGVGLVTFITWVIKTGIDAAVIRTAPAKDTHVFERLKLYYSTIPIAIMFLATYVIGCLYAFFCEFLPWLITDSPNEAELIERCDFWGGQQRLEDISKLNTLLKEDGTLLNEKRWEYMRSKRHYEEEFGKACNKFFASRRANAGYFLLFSINILIPWLVCWLLYDAQSTFKPKLEELG